MNNQEKLNHALSLMREILADEDRGDIFLEYPKTLMSFYELIAEIALIRMK